LTANNKRMSSTYSCKPHQRFHNGTQSCTFMR